MVKEGRIVKWFNIFNTSILLPTFSTHIHHVGRPTYPHNIALRMKPKTEVL